MDASARRRASRPARARTAARGDDKSGGSPSIRRVPSCGMVAQEGAADLFCPAPSADQAKQRGLANVEIDRAGSPSEGRVRRPGGPRSSRCLWKSSNVQSPDDGGR